nr:DinB family protein [Paenibacillus bovis]
MKKLTIQLFEYHVWANKKLIKHLRSLPEEVFVNQVNSVFPTIAETFGHMLAVDEMCYLRLKGVYLQQIGQKKLNTIEETENKLDDLYDDINHFFINIESVENTVVYKNTKGNQFNNKVFEIVQHIVNHGTYHRGNIAAMIRQLGYEGTSTDYIFYLRTINNII